MKREHNFGEKEYEGDKTVWQTPKFLSSREKAIEMIESEKYGLEDADFWILKNTYDKQLLDYFNEFENISQNEIPDIDLPDVKIRDLKPIANGKRI